MQETFPALGAPASLVEEVMSTIRPARSNKSYKHESHTFRIKRCNKNSDKLLFLWFLNIFK